MAPGRKQPRKILRRNLPSLDAHFACNGLRGEGRVINISRNGFFLRTAKLPAVGSEIHVVLSGLQGEVKVTGTVRWTTAQLPEEGGRKVQPGFGVQVAESDAGFRDLFSYVLTH